MLAKKAVTVFVVGFVLLSVACGNSRTFDSTSWLKAGVRERGRMTEDLVKRRVLIGKTAEETQQLLGRADTDYGRALSYKIDLGWPLKDRGTMGSS
jgi:hypothetical protein